MEPNTVEYAVRNDARQPVDNTFYTTVIPTVSATAQITHSFQHPNVPENPQPPMLPEVTTLSATEIQTIRPNGINANQDDPANDVLPNPDAATPIIPEDVSQTVSQNRTTEEHYKWFTSVHNCWMGHRGAASTLALLQQREYVWDTMKQDVHDLILRCPVCQKLSVND